MHYTTNWLYLIVIKEIKMKDQVGYEIWDNLMCDTFSALFVYEIGFCIFLIFVWYWYEEYNT